MMGKCGLLGGALLVVFLSMAQAQDLPVEEDPFAQATDTIVETGSETVDLDALTKGDLLTVGGSTTASGAVIGGWESLFGSEIPIWNPGFFFAMNSSLSMDARPSSSLHVHGDISATAPVTDSLSWSGISLGELWLDYTLAETFTFRVGKFGGSMGQGRLLNPGNLLTGQTTGLTLRASAPLINGSFALWAFAQDGFMESQADWKGIGSLATFDGSLARASYGLAARYQRDTGLVASSYVKTTIAGADLALEATAALPKIGALDNQLLDSQVWLLVSSFWEGFSPKIRFQAEYVYSLKSQEILDWDDHTLALAVLGYSIPGIGIRPGLTYTQYFIDGSGQVILGLEKKVDQHFTLSLGVPLTWGSETSRAYQKNTDPGKRELSLVLKLDLNASY